MKNYCLFFAALSICAAQTLEGKQPEEVPIPQQVKQPYSVGKLLVEAKAANFRPTSSIFKDTYGKDVGIYGLEISAQAWKRLYVWTSGSYLHKAGHTSLRTSTTVTLIPLALGVKYIHSYEHVAYYLGAAPLTVRVHTHDDPPSLIHHITKWGYGGTAKAGLLINMGKYFFLDLFGDYSYMKAQFHHTDGGKIIPHNADFSGWSAGIGFGYRL